MTGITSETLSSPGTPLVRVIDKWIWVFMAGLFIAITLIGFIPDSAMKMGLVEAGKRPPFPLVLHLHAVLMGSFLLMLFTQSVLMATGHRQLHQSVGILGAVLALAVVVVGIVLVPTMYHQGWDAAQAAPQAARAEILQGLRTADDIMLLQLRIGILFPIFILTALAVRKTDPGLHKRFMFLAVAMPLPAAFDRITWIPGTMPVSPLSPDLYVLLAVSPIIIWDLVRTHKVHKAYLIWLGVNIPLSIFIHTAWDTNWWHAIAPRIVGL